MKTKPVKRRGSTQESKKKQADRTAMTIQWISMMVVTAGKETLMSAFEMDEERAAMWAVLTLQQVEAAIAEVLEAQKQVLREAK